MPKLVLPVVMTLGACAHATEGTGASAERVARDTRAARLESDLARYEARMTELEARMALLEEEARGERAAVRPTQTVRIGAARARAAEASPFAPEAETDSAQASTQRVPVLRLHGVPRPAPRDAAELGPLPEPPPGVSMQLPVVALPEQVAVAVEAPDAREQYRAALEHMRAQRYAQARKELEAFTARHPAHPLASSASYWLGEVFYAEREYGRALEIFEGVVERDPKGDKVPDALLKLGMCHKRLGDAQRAERYLRRVRQEFPNSPAAHIATREGSS